MGQAGTSPGSRLQGGQHGPAGAPPQRPPPPRPLPPGGVRGHRVGGHVVRWSGAPARSLLRCPVRAARRPSGPEPGEPTLYEPPAPETFSDTVLEALDQLEEAGDRLGILRLFLVDMVGNSEDAFAFIQQRPIWPIMLDNALTLPAELRSARRYRFDPSEVAGLAVPTLVLVGELSGPEVVDAAGR